MATGIGESLVAARRQQGVSLADAAAETRVRESYLAALEEEDFAALGGDVYVKGFLRSYARFLRLDPEPLLAIYRAQFERAPEEASPLAHQPVGPMPSEGRPGIVIGAGVAVLVLILLAVIGLVGGRDTADEEDLAGAPEPVASEVTPGGAVDPTVPAVEATEEPTDEPTEAPTDEPTEVLTSDGVELTLDISGGPSWLVVTVDGETEVESEQPDGTSLTFEADETIDVVIGDAGVVNVTVNGDDRGRLGERSEVVEKTYTARDA